MFVHFHYIFSKNLKNFNDRGSIRVYKLVLYFFAFVTTYGEKNTDFHAEYFIINS